VAEKAVAKPATKPAVAAARKEVRQDIKANIAKKTEKPVTKAQVDKRVANQKATGKFQEKVQAAKAEAKPAAKPTTAQTINKANAEKKVAKPAVAAARKDVRGQIAVNIEKKTGAPATKEQVQKRVDKQKETGKFQEKVQAAKTAAKAPAQVTKPSRQKLQKLQRQLQRLQESRRQRLKRPQRNGQMKQQKLLLKRRQWFRRKSQWPNLRLWHSLQRQRQRVSPSLMRVQSLRERPQGWGQLQLVKKLWSWTRTSWIKDWLVTPLFVALKQTPPTLEAKHLQRLKFSNALLPKYRVTQFRRDRRRRMTTCVKEQLWVVLVECVQRWGAARRVVSVQIWVWPRPKAVHSWVTSKATCSKRSNDSNHNKAVKADSNHLKAVRADRCRSISSHHRVGKAAKVGNISVDSEEHRKLRQAPHRTWVMS
jgi:hypothetical protein